MNNPPLNQEGNIPLTDINSLENYESQLNDIVSVRILPKQDYYKTTVFPILLEGLAWLIKKRPEDPVESLALFLIKNNPYLPDDKIAYNIDERI